MCQIVDLRLDLKIGSLTELALELGDIGNKSGPGISNASTGQRDESGGAGGNSFDGFRSEAGFLHERAGREVFWHGSIITPQVLAARPPRTDHSPLASEAVGAPQKPMSKPVETEISNLHDRLAVQIGIRMVAGVLEDLEQRITAMLPGILHLGTVNLNDQEQSEVLGDVVRVRTIAIEDEALPANTLHVFGSGAGFTGIQRRFCAVAGQQVENTVDVAVGFSECRVLVLGGVEVQLVSGEHHHLIALEGPVG